MQDLATIQAEIQALRSSIPIFLTPLLNRPPEQASDTAAAEEFRSKATKIQGDVKMLVAHLESMCSTLEAAEKVRIEDFDELGNAVKIERVGVAREYTDKEKDVKAEDGGEAETVPEFTGDLQFDDFGLNEYSDIDWSSLNLPGDSNGV